MAALSGAQPAQRSAGPKRAAWQRALFRFPIPNRRKGVLRHTLLPSVRTVLRCRGFCIERGCFIQTKDFRKKKWFMKLCF